MARDQEIPKNVFIVLNTQLIPIKKEVTRLGRLPNNDVIISEADISRFHAEIHFRKGKFILKDLNARNGTFINGEQISSQALQSGDTITMGGTPLLFIDRSEKIVEKMNKETVSLDELDL